MSRYIAPGRPRATGRRCLLGRRSNTGSSRNAGKRSADRRRRNPPKSSRPASDCPKGRWSGRFGLSLGVRCQALGPARSGIRPSTPTAQKRFSPGSEQARFAFFVNRSRPRHRTSKASGGNFPTAEIPARSGDLVRKSEGRAQAPKLAVCQTLGGPATARRYWFFGCDFHILEVAPEPWTQGLHC